ncbi:cytochrome c oxidase subunit 5B, mitochondrial-like isoform X2 [Eurosta solidaginis]|uniref:cytochrome c oxidase subunit 5B, mitochondrial-like isoform X2 n=1 Tax=Eurosta solidaginis TaxID=178769 RepID=UPI0035305AB4
MEQERLETEAAFKEKANFPRVVGAMECTHVKINSTVMNDPLEHATGIERREVLAKATGNDNPFDIKVFKRGAGTKENPNLIPSAFDARIVGCICEEDQTYVQWMWLQKSTLKRSECGHWFTLVEKAAV